MKLCMGREQNTRSKDENLSTELCFVYFSDVVDYSYEDLLSSILPIYQTLLESGIEILVFR
jgi:hypothetical protein